MTKSQPWLVNNHEGNANLQTHARCLYYLVSLTAVAVSVVEVLGSSTYVENVTTVRDANAIVKRFFYEDPLLQKGMLP
jgi:hypothetical protein